MNNSMANKRRRQKIKIRTSLKQKPSKGTIAQATLKRKFASDATLKLDGNKKASTFHSLTYSNPDEETTISVREKWLLS